MMNTVKNFIYNISDILVALLIIVIAVIIIGWRVNSIMDYPSRIAAEQAEQTSVTSSQTDSDSGDTSSQTPASDTAAAPVTVTIPQNATVDDIASSLANASVISDPEQFVRAVEAAGAATKLKYGTYTIPDGTSVDQIIQMLTS